MDGWNYGLIVQICPVGVSCYFALERISSQIKVTGSQGFDEAVSTGCRALRLPPLLQQLHRRLVEIRGMASGDGLQLHFIQTQFATQSTPRLSQIFGDDRRCNVEFGWRGEE